MVIIKKTVIRVLYKYFIRRMHHRVGASLARIMYGFWFLSYDLQSFEIRHFIWGELGPVTHDMFLRDLKLLGGFSLLTYSSSPLWFEALFFLGIISAILVIAGLFTHISMIFSLTLLWSFHTRNEYILDGGDNIARIIIFFFFS